MRTMRSFSLFFPQLFVHDFDHHIQIRRNHLQIMVNRRQQLIGSVKHCPFLKRTPQIRKNPRSRMGSTSPKTEAFYNFVPIVEKFCQIVNTLSSRPSLKNPRQSPKSRTSRTFSNISENFDSARSIRLNKHHHLLKLIDLIIFLLYRSFQYH